MVSVAARKKTGRFVEGRGGGEAQGVADPKKKKKKTGHAYSHIFLTIERIRQPPPNLETMATHMCARGSPIIHV
jgi:hypothetical protein